MNFVNSHLESLKVCSHSYDVAVQSRYLKLVIAEVGSHLVFIGFAFELPHYRMDVHLCPKSYQFVVILFELVLNLGL